MQDTVQQVVETFGGVDIVIANAGIASAPRWRRCPNCGGGP